MKLTTNGPAMIRAIKFILLRCGVLPLTVCLWAAKVQAQEGADYDAGVGSCTVVCKGLPAVLKTHDGIPAYWFDDPNLGTRLSGLSATYSLGSISSNVTYYYSTDPNPGGTRFPADAKVILAESNTIVSDFATCINTATLFSVGENPSGRALAAGANAGAMGPLNSFPSSATDNFSIVANVKWKGALAGNPQQWIVMNGNGNSGWDIYVEGSNNKLYVRLGSVATLVSDVVLPIDKWTNIALVRRAGLWRLYINSEEKALGNSTQTPLAPVAGRFSIGVINSGVAGFNGAIDEVSLWNEALDIKGVNNVRVNSANINELSGSNQAGHWSFNETSGTTVADLSGKGFTLTLTSGTQRTGTSTYLWNFSGGSSANGIEVSQTFTSGGDKNINLIVVDQFGCSVDKSKTLNVSTFPLPAVYQTVTVDGDCAGSLVSLKASGGGILVAENFNGVLPAGWVQEYPWTGDQPVSRFPTPDGTSGYTGMNTEFRRPLPTGAMRTPAFSTLGLSSVTVAIEHTMALFNASTYRYWVEASTDNVNWTAFASYNNRVDPFGYFWTDKIILPNEWLNKPQVWVRFLVKPISANSSSTADYEYWCINNLWIYAGPVQPQYVWTSDPSGFTSSWQSPLPQRPQVTTTYTVKTSNGCASTPVSATVVIKPMPTAKVTGSINVCKNATSPNITFTGYGATAPYTFVYKINGREDITVTSASGVATCTVAVPTGETGRFDYSLVSVSSANGCGQGQSGSATVNIKTPITASMTVPPNLCVGTTAAVRFSSTSTAPTTTFTYFSGTTKTVTTAKDSNSINVSIATSAAATIGYVFTRATDSEGCSYTPATSPTVNTLITAYPTVHLSPTTALACGDSIQLTGTGASEYVITGTDGSVYRIPNPKVVPDRNTTYAITGSVNGCSTVSADKAVVTNRQISGSIASSANMVCAGGTVNLTSSVAEANVSIFKEDFEAAKANWNTTSKYTLGSDYEYQLPAANWQYQPNGFTSKSALWPNGVTTLTPGSGMYICNVNISPQYNYTVNNKLISPKFSTLSYTNLKLRISDMFQASSGSVGRIEISTDAANWTEIGVTGVNPSSLAPPFKLSDFSIPAQFGNQSSVYLRFTYAGYALGLGWAIDFIEVSGSKSISSYSWTSVPTALVASSVNVSNVSTPVDRVYKLSVTNGVCTNYFSTDTVKALSAPTATLGTAGAFANNTTMSLPYTVTSGLPDSYSVTSTGGSAMPGFVAITDAALTSLAGTLSIPVPSLPDGTYNFTLKLQNKAMGCTSSTQSFSATVLTNNNNLRSLVANNGAVSPAFTAATISYLAPAISSTTSQVSITPTTEDSRSTMTINGQTATSGVAKTLSLLAGVNDIAVAVTSQQGQVKTYTVRFYYFPAAPPGNALSFDGVDDKIFMSQGSFHNLTQGTYEAWVYLNDSTKRQSILTRQVNGKPSVSAWGMGHTMNSVSSQDSTTTTGKVYFRSRNTSPILESTSKMRQNQWIHLAVTFSSTGASLYVNGILDATTAGDFSIPNVIESSNPTIGAWLGDGGGKYFNGKIDELRVWNVVRTQQEILQNQSQIINPFTSGLVGYYSFDRGIRSGTNTGINTLFDLSGAGNDGSMNNFFSLTGSSSNWVESYATVVPTALAATGISPSTFTANWTKPALDTVDNYLLDLSTDTLFGSFVSGYQALQVSGLSKPITGLLAGTKYFYRIRANKASVAGQGAYSATIKATTSQALSIVGISTGVYTAPAYSLRKLGSNYTGNAISVRRGSDNALQDIGFTSNGDLDTASLKTFVGVGNGYVATWYDQSGFGYHAVQAAASTQPIIVTAGTIQRLNRRPSIYFGTANLATAKWVMYPTGVSMVGVAKGNGAANAPSAIITKTGTAAGANLAYPGPFDYTNNGSEFTVGNAATQAYNSINTGTTTPRSDINMLVPASVYSFVIPSSGTYRNYLNGADVGSKAVPAYEDNGNSLMMGNRNSLGSKGDMWLPEMVLFNSVISDADRQLMEASQKAYYLSNDATLSALTTSMGILAPYFSPTVTTYRLAKGNTSSITVTPTSSNAGATIQMKVNQSEYVYIENGVAVENIQLNATTNDTIDVKVTSQDGSSIKTYSILLMKTNPLNNVGLTTSTPASPAYGLRLLSNNYTGSAIKVRRSSDNVMTDIGFTSNGDLDTAALKTFVGTAGGFVTKWYDQSGFGYDAVQLIAANQPRIVNVGTVERYNDKPAIYFGNATLATDKVTIFTNGTSMVGVAKGNSLTPSALVTKTGIANDQLTNYPAPFDFTNNGGEFTVGSPADNQYFTYMNLQNATPASHVGSTVPLSVYSFTVPTYGNCYTYVNGEQRDNVNIYNYSDGGNPLMIGNRNDGASSGNFWTPEIVLFNSVLSTADRQALEASQRAYYLTTTAYVDADKGDDDNTDVGISWAKAYKTLSKALDAARTNTDITTIKIASGIYYPGGSALAADTYPDTTFGIYRNKLKIYGGYNATTGQRDPAVNKTILDGHNSSYHVMVMTGITAGDSIVIDGITIRNGKAVTAATNFYNGIGVNSNEGAGVIMRFNAAIGNKIAFRNCVFVNNNADSYGGAMYCGRTSPMVSNCVFVSNSANNAAAIFNYTLASPIITNCTFALNTCKNSGGQALASMINSLPIVTNSIIWDNTGGASNDAASPVVALKSLVQTIDASGAADNPLFINTTDPIGADGIWGTADDGLRIQSCSPAVNSGNNASIGDMGTDIKGNGRIQGGTVDMGAYEFTGASKNGLPSVADKIAVNGESSTNTIESGQAIQLVVDGLSCDVAVAALQSTGNHPVTGEIAAKVWVSSDVPMYSGIPYVQRHYDISPEENAATATARVTLYYTQAEFDAYNSTVNMGLLGLPAEPNGYKTSLRVYQTHGTSSDSSGSPGSYTGGSTIINPADNDIVWNEVMQRWEVSFNVTGFSGFFLAADGLIILPVKLLSFTGSIGADKTARLNWQIASPEAGVRYELQRSFDGNRYTSIHSQTGSNSSTSFQYSDSLVINGLHYYRLKVIDIDGGISYSNVVVLDGQVIVAGKIVLYPNPVNKGDGLQISISNGTIRQYRLSTATGQVVMQQNNLRLSGGISLRLPVALAAGVYYLQLYTDKGVSNERVVVR